MASPPSGPGAAARVPYSVLRVRPEPGTWALVVASALLAFAAASHWIYTPLQGPTVPQTPLFRPICLVAAVLVGLSALRRSWAWIGAMGSVLAVSFSIFFWVDAGLRDRRLWDWIDENAQYVRMARFSGLYLPAHRGFDRTLVSPVSTERVDQRMMTATRFLARGWWLCLSAGTLALLVVSLDRRRRAPWQVAALTACVTFLPTTAPILAGQVVLQARERDGDALLAQLSYREAIERYGQAMSRSPQAALSERLHSKVGQASLQMGQSQSPSARLARANQLIRLSDMEAVIEELRLALDAADAAQRQVLRRRLGWALSEQGLDRYAKDNVLGAVASWEEARGVSPEQHQAVFYLGWAYYVQNRYADCLAVVEEFREAVNRSDLEARAEANRADSLTELGRHEEARRSYRTSLFLDGNANFRSTRGLGGT